MSACMCVCVCVNTGADKEAKELCTYAAQCEAQLATWGKDAQHAQHGTSTHTASATAHAAGPTQLGSYGLYTPNTAAVTAPHAVNTRAAAAADKSAAPPPLHAGPRGAPGRIPSTGHHTQAPRASAAMHLNFTTPHTNTNTTRDDLGSHTNTVMVKVRYGASLSTPEDSFAFHAAGAMGAVDMTPGLPAGASAAAAVSPFYADTPSTDADTPHALAGAPQSLGVGSMVGLTGPGAHPMGVSVDGYGYGASVGGGVHTPGDDSGSEYATPVFETRATGAPPPPRKAGGAHGKPQSASQPRPCCTLHAAWGRARTYLQFISMCGCASADNVLAGR